MVYYGSGLDVDVYDIHLLLQERCIKMYMY